MRLHNHSLTDHSGRQMLNPAKLIGNCWRGGRRNRLHLVYFNKSKIKNPNHQQITDYLLTKTITQWKFPKKKEKNLNTKTCKIKLQQQKQHQSSNNKEKLNKMKEGTKKNDLKNQN